MLLCQPPLSAGLRDPEPSLPRGRALVSWYVARRALSACTASWTREKCCSSSGWRQCSCRLRPKLTSRLLGHSSNSPGSVPYLHNPVCFGQQNLSFPPHKEFTTSSKTWGTAYAGLSWQLWLMSVNCSHQRRTTRSKLELKLYYSKLTQPNKHKKIYIVKL